MTARDFVYWLQGYFELEGDDISSLDARKISLIKNHLALVFKHEIDPSMGDQLHQQELYKIHNPIKMPMYQTPPDLTEYEVGDKPDSDPKVTCHNKWQGQKFRC